jgi:hypothetical protein
MNFKVTRDVVSDLWPLCRSGDASADSRALVDEFLAQDETFATTLHESEMLPGAVPALRLSPDAERRLLDEAQRRARLKLQIIGGSVALAGFILLVALGGALFLAIRGF